MLKEKTARRFLKRNAQKIILGEGNVSFWNRVEKCRYVLSPMNRDKMSVDERIFHMFQNV